MSSLMAHSSRWKLRPELAGLVWRSKAVRLIAFCSSAVAGVYGRTRTAASAMSTARCLSSALASSGSD